MKTKILSLLIFIIGLLSPIFALNNDSIYNKLENIFTYKIDKKLENKYKTNEKICSAKKRVYTNILNKLKKINNAKYIKIINIISNFTKNRLENIKECYQIIGKNPKLTFKIDKKLLYNTLKNDKGFTIPQRTKFQVSINNTVNKISKMINDRYIKIDNKWYFIKKARILNTNKIDNNIINDVLKENPGKKVAIYKNNIYVFSNNDLISLGNIDIEKNLDENKNNLLKNGIFVFSDLSYKKYNGNKIIVAGMQVINNRLLYFVAKAKSSFYITKDEDNLYKILANNDDIKVIVKDGNNYTLWISGIKIYDLGNKELYKNIDLNKLGNILRSSFQKIAIYNLNYSYKDMYKILLLAYRFNNKNLKDIYKHLAEEISYNKDISKYLKNDITQDELDKIIESDEKLYKLWNMFGIYKNKEAICQSLSELLSIIALFNGQSADIQTGWISYPHQISKINNYYYDLTNDLGKKDNFKYFAMKKMEVLKYFRFVNF